MNNLEANDDFLKLMKETYPNLTLSERDKMIIQMAINHAYLVICAEKEGESDND